jgi:hypothetical protein
MYCNITVINTTTNSIEYEHTDNMYCTTVSEAKRMIMSKYDQQCLVKLIEIELHCCTMSEAFHALKSQYGRCTGKVYIDQPDGAALHIGYVFTSEYDGRTYKYWCILYATKKLVYEYITD